MAKIKEVHAREILNAKGNPTIEATVVLSDGTLGVASFPSGTYQGKYEAVKILDEDPNRFEGKGVLKAVETIEKIIAPSLFDLEASNQQQVDRTLINLDGTQNKATLGANATLVVSMAVAKAAAKSAVLPLYLHLRQFIHKDSLPLKIPTPMFNLISGGKHGDGNVDLEEFLLIPGTFKSYEQALEIGDSVYHHLEKILKENGFTTLTGVEGGFAPNLASNEDGFSLLNNAVNAIGLRLGYDVFFGLDAAATYFYWDQHYRLKERTTQLSPNDLIDYYTELMKKYHILYLEDALSEDDWDGWAKLETRMSNETLIVGDDLTATNPYRLQMALDKKAINGIVIKPSQIGTVIESLAVVEVARVAGLKIIVSQRSGETVDDFIADFAVAVSADYVKFGAPARGEHVVKYNRLLEIEKQLKIL